VPVSNGMPASVRTSVCNNSLTAERILIKFIGDFFFFTEFG